MDEGPDLVEGAKLLPLGLRKDALEVVRVESGGEVQDCPRSIGDGQPVPVSDLVGGEPSDAVESDTGPWTAQGARAGNVDGLLESRLGHDAQDPGRCTVCQHGVVAARQ
jgi:hypothetical protein